MILRTVFKALGAIIIFFTVDAAINAAVYLLVLLVNRYASGLTSLALPFWARGIASFAGAYTAIAALERLFPDYPRRGVAVVIFIFFGVVILFSLLGVLNFEQDWPDRQPDLAILIGAIITILTVRSGIYQKGKISN